MRPRDAIRRHPVAAFVVLTYAVSWAWWLPLLWRGEVTRAGQGWPTHLPGLLGPAIAAAVVTAVVDGQRGLADLWSRMTRWRVGRLWWIVVATVALAALALVAPLLVGQTAPGVDAFGRYSGIGEIGWPAMVLVAFLVNGMGEETGWRGFLAERLLDRHGLTRTALLVALAWAPWHLPTFWVVESFRDRGVLGMAGWVVGIAAASVVLVWLYRVGRRSILFVGAWHTAFNLTSATEATADVIAVVTSALVIGAAVWILRREASSSAAGERRREVA